MGGAGEMRLEGRHQGSRDPSDVKGNFDPQCPQSTLATLSPWNLLAEDRGQTAMAADRHPPHKPVDTAFPLVPEVENRAAGGGGSSALGGGLGVGAAVGQQVKHAVCSQGIHCSHASLSVFSRCT